MKAKQSNKQFKRIVAVSGISILLLGGAYVATQAQNKQGQGEVTISREREFYVERGTIVAGIDGSGKIVLNQVEVKYKNAGKIKEVYVKEGQRVSEGDKVAISSQDRILYATASGVISEVGVQAGDEITRDTAVVTIANSKSVVAQLSVSQENVLDLEAGQTVYLWVNAHQGVKFNGEVEFVKLLPSSGGNGVTYDVFVTLDPEDYEILDGMSVAAQFILKEKKDILTLTNKAIILKDNKQYVRMRNSEGEIEEHEIDTGFSDGRKTEIINGLNEGDVVIVGGE